MASLYMSMPGEDVWTMRITYRQAINEGYVQAAWNDVQRIIAAYDEPVREVIVGRLPTVGDYDEYRVTVRYDAGERGRTETEGANRGKVPSGNGSRPQGLAESLTAMVL